MASVASFGGYVHADNELNLVRADYRSAMSPRGKRLNTVATFHLFGELIDTGSSLISAARDLMLAYQSDYRDFRYTVDGVVAHEMLNGTADNISGVRVIHRSFAKGDGAELAVKRSYSIVLQATFDTAEQELVYWQEQIAYIGNTGPSYEIVQTYNGPYSILTAISTPQRIIQSGKAIGYSTYVLPPGPYAPNSEHQDQRRVTLTGGSNMGQASRFYTTEWSYFMTFGTYTELYPQVR
jgi:hypothetical protein